MSKPAVNFEDVDLSEEIQQALTSSEIHFDQIEFLRYSVNKNYKIVCPEQILFLRIYRPGKETREQILAEHEFLSFLKQNELGVPAPLTLKSGDSLGQIQTPAGPAFFALFDFLNGTHPTDLNEFALNWGRSLGRLHNLSLTFGKTRKAYERRSWNQASWVSNSEELLQEIVIDEQAYIFLQERDRVLDYLSRLPESSDVFGLVHYDFHPGSILIERDKVQILDFDDCCKSWFLWDFALPMHRLGGHMSSRGADQKTKFVQGYKETMALDPDWENRIRPFERIRHLFMLCWLAERRTEGKWKEVVPRYAKAHSAYLAAFPKLEEI